MALTISAWSDARLGFIFWAITILPCRLAASRAGLGQPGRNSRNRVTAPAIFSRPNSTIPFRYAGPYVHARAGRVFESGRADDCPGHEAGPNPAGADLAGAGDHRRIRGWLVSAGSFEQTVRPRDLQQRGARGQGWRISERH